MQGNNSALRKCKCNMHFANAKQITVPLANHERNNRLVKYAGRSSSPTNLNELKRIPGHSLWKALIASRGF